MPSKNKASQKPTVRTTVSLPRDDYSELELMAEQKKVSVAWVVRQAVEEYLQNKSPLLQSRK